MTKPHPDPKPAPIAKRIRHRREQIGTSQAELGRRTGVTPGAVAQWEAGLSMPSPRRLVALSEALEASVDWLISGQGMPAPPRAAAPVPSAAVPLDAGLVEQARELDIDVVARLEDHLRRLLAEARRRVWLEENHGALQDAHAFLERHGLWSDGRRQF